MRQRIPTWWRVLGVVLVALVAWPGPLAWAASPVALAVVHQDEVVPLSPHGVGAMRVVISHPGSAAVQITAYGAVVYRSEIDSLLTAQPAVGSPITSTGVVSLTCSRGLQTTLVVSVLSLGSHETPAKCGAQSVSLHLPCLAVQCSGVYPLQIRLIEGSDSSTIWSLVTVTKGSIPQPLRVALVGIVNPSTWSNLALANADFASVANHASTPLTLALDYRALADAVSVPGAQSWRTGLSAALRSPLHRAIAAPPPTIDYAGLARNGFSGQVAQQVNLAGTLLQDLVGQSTDAPVFLQGGVSAQSVAAVAASGSRNVIIDDTALDPAPSSTLTWGAPFNIAGAPGATGLATDSGLATLMAQASLQAGPRAALVTGDANFLHFEAPNDPAVRTVVIPFVMGTLSPVFLDELFSSLSNDPYVSLSSVTPSFSTSLIGSNGSPSFRTLATPVLLDWSNHNVATLATLLQRSHSFLGAITTPSRAGALSASVEQAEILGGASVRQHALDGSLSALTHLLEGVSIDNSTVTLAGSGTSLPITIFSSLHYPITVVAHLITDRLTFPGGSQIPISIDHSTTALRINVSKALGSSLILQIVLTTPDNRLQLTRTALAVHVSGISWVGYALSALSLIVLVLWWVRTHRRRIEGRHLR